MCQSEKGKSVDCSKVKRNVRECAKLDDTITKSNKPLVFKLFLEEDDWCLAPMCLCVIPTGSVNIASDTILKDKYVEVMKVCVDDMAKKPIVPVEYYLQQISIDAFMEELGQRQFHGATLCCRLQNIVILLRV
eukprot:8322310-Ditylum_brightwellii.AAC.1